jgi:hypothetical protein
VKRVVKGPIMNERGFVTVSMRELKRIKIIAAVAEHRLLVPKAAPRIASYLNLGMQFYP